MRKDYSVNRIRMIVVVPGVNDRPWYLAALATSLRHVFSCAAVISGSVLASPFGLSLRSLLRLSSCIDVMELRFGVLVLDFEAMAFVLFLASPLFVVSGFLDTSFRLSPAEAPTGTGIRVAVAGVRFHQVVGGVRYPLNALELQGISIVGVY